MTSKEALERLDKHFYLRCYSFDTNENSNIREYEIIKQDLERLERVELINENLNIENASLRSENISMHNKVAILESENLTLKKIIKEKSKLEKELKQTKLNFRNSQTHSKNCYKKLKKENEELKKVIEVLCANNIHIRTLKLSKNVDEYNSQIENYSYYDELEQKEYDLLKEVFGNDTKRND